MLEVMCETPHLTPLPRRGLSPAWRADAHSVKSRSSRWRISLAEGNKVMEVNTNPAMEKWVMDRLREEHEKPKPSPHSTQLIYCLTKSYYALVDPLPLSDREVLLFSVGFGM